MAGRFARPHLAVWLTLALIIARPAPGDEEPRVLVPTSAKGSFPWRYTTRSPGPDWHRPGQADPDLWQHDLYRGDLRAYAPAEIDAFRRAIRSSRREAPTDAR